MKIREMGDRVYIERKKSLPVRFSLLIRVYWADPRVLRLDFRGAKTAYRL